jgi:hypothetical protein
VPAGQFIANLLGHGHVLGRKVAGCRLVVAGQGQHNGTMYVVTVGAV